jgi:hypothetical protein
MLSQFFHSNEPSLELVRYEDHVARFQLHDCDEYRIGRLIFSDTSVLCVGTQEEPYRAIQIYGENDLPVDFAWLKDSMPRGRVLVVLEIAQDEEDSNMPRIGNQRRGFIICGEVTFEEETNPGR